MLRSEFYELTGLTENAIDYPMYEEIEKIYMNSTLPDKQTFCKWFYDLYNNSVSHAVSERIKNASLEDKLILIDNKDKSSLSLECDLLRIEKTWKLISLLR